jgi:2-dehydropantoate 2-reductase
MTPQTHAATARVCIVGCGAVGSLYAAHLAGLPDVEVWAFDVSAQHVEAINRDGLRLIGAYDIVAPVHARTDPAAIPPCAFGILATKGGVTASAAAATAPIFVDAAVCSVQNGIGNEEVLAGHVPRVMRGVTLPAGRVAGPGVAEIYAPGPTWIGPFEPAPARFDEIEALAGLLNAAGLQTTACADARGPQWTKLLFNAATNPLCALTGLTHGEMWDHPPTRELSGQLVAEGLAVARALEIELHDDPLAMIEQGARINYRHRPSMLQDVLAKRPTEIDMLNGGIVREGAAHGVMTPLNAAVHALVTGLQGSWQ